MPINVVATDSFLITETGPAPASMIGAGVDRVVVVDVNGVLSLSAVKAIRPIPDVLAARVLTEAGDVVVPSGAFAMTSRGPTSGAEIEEALRKDQTVRIDVVSPEDLPRAKKVKVSVVDVYRSCLEALPGGIIQLPCGNGIADAMETGILELLRQAEVEHRVVRNDRWVTFVLGPIEATADGARGEFELQADALSMITAWAGDGEHLESRVRVGDCGLRRRLLAAATGAGRGFSVRWVPGYCPVEARVRIGDERAWPARAIVLGAEPVIAEALLVETATRGDLIVSLAVLRPDAKA